MPRKRRESNKEEKKKENTEEIDRNEDGSENDEEGASKIAEAAHSIVMDLADLLKSVLNSGLVVVGDVRLKIEDVEVPIKLRLLVTMIKKAKEEGINWWEKDPFYSKAESDQVEKLKKEKEDLKGQMAEKRTGRKSTARSKRRTIRKKKK